MELVGKVAVVTGASSGIGEASARALAAEGMAVVAVARRKERLDALADEHPTIHPFPADVTGDEQVAALATWVGEQLGSCHVLVNCAGAIQHQPFRGPGDVEEIRATMDLNFGGYVRCMGAFADLLAASAPSRVVNVASVAGKLAGRPAGYVASKFATVGFTEAVGAQWAGKGIAVCQVNPGFVVTEGFRREDMPTGSWLGRRLLSELPEVATAIVDVARRGTPERTVPRWQRLLVLGRHAGGGPLYRWALRHI